MKNRVYNFSAGPAVLPEEVLKTARAAIWDFNESGIGILEHSHRSAEFSAVIASAEARMRKLAEIPDEYAVLFLQGGASSQFFMVPMNLLPDGGTADYLVTGAWSKKALKEAARFGEVHTACSGEENQFTAIPDQVTFSEKPAYVHYTSNNTIFGTQWEQTPRTPSGVPLVCDASSDILSRPIEVRKHGLIYAGAQKNLGPAGLTVVILRKDLAERAPKSLPTMLQYRTHIENGSLFNTPPSFAIFVLNEVLAWIEQQGGLRAMQDKNRAKAGLLYRYLDDSDLFYTPVPVGSRSQMNVCFLLRDPSLTDAFVEQATARGLSGLRGHRSVGGMRASIYNAFPQAGVTALVAFMKEFEEAHR